MEPEKPAFAISVPSEDPNKKTDGDDAPKEDTNATDSKPSQDAPSKEVKTEPSGDELVRPSNCSTDLTCALTSSLAPCSFYSRRRTSSSRVSSRCLSRDSRYDHRIHSPSSLLPSLKAEAPTPLLGGQDRVSDHLAHFL